MCGRVTCTLHICYHTAQATAYTVGVVFFPNMDVCMLFLCVVIKPPNVAGIEPVMGSTNAIQHLVHNYQSIITNNIVMCTKSRAHTVLQAYNLLTHMPDTVLF